MMNTFFSSGIDHDVIDDAENDGDTWVAIRKLTWKLWLCVCSFLFALAHHLSLSQTLLLQVPVDKWFISIYVYRRSMRVLFLPPLETKKMRVLMMFLSFRGAKICKYRYVHVEDFYACGTLIRAIIINW